MTEKVKPTCPKCGLDYDNPDEKCNRVPGWLARWVRKPVFVPVPTDEQQGLPEETTVDAVAEHVAGSMSVADIAKAVLPAEPAVETPDGEPPTDGLIRHP